MRLSIARRRCLAMLTAPLIATPSARSHADAATGGDPPWTLFTFGDSILDCGRYNAHGIDPGQLLVRNDDVLFPEFKGRDLQTRGPVRLEHRAVDGATVDDLAAQARGLRTSGPGVALL